MVAHLTLRPLPPVPARPQPQLMSQVRKALERIGLGEYADAFIAEGFDTWDIVLDITESDLTDLGVKLGHRRKLQRAIADSRQQSAESSPQVLDKAADPRAHAAPAVTTESGQAVRTKRKYKRHPKPDLNAPERPASAYVLFSNHMRDVLKDHDLSFTAMAKIVGEKWQVLPADEREGYESRASAAKEKYAAEMAEYKKTEDYQLYQQYLVEFKATHNPGTGGDKRVKLDAETSNNDASSPDTASRSRRTSIAPHPMRHLRLESRELESTKSASPTASLFSAAHSPAAAVAPASPAHAAITRPTPYEAPRYAPHNAHTLPRDRHYSRPEPPQYGPPLTMSTLSQAAGPERPAPLLSSHSSSSMSTVPSLTKESSVMSQDSSSPGTPFQAIMQEGAPRFSRVLPAPGGLPLQGTTSGSFVLDHRPLPPKVPVAFAADEDPRNSASLAALLRAGELAREADSSHPTPPA